MPAPSEKLERLHIHIAGLEATLARRNETIVSLEAKVEQLKVNPITDAEYKKAYRSGWQACARHLQDVTKKTAVDLGKVSGEAWRLYLKAETGDIYG